MAENMVNDNINIDDDDSRKVVFILKPDFLVASNINIILELMLENNLTINKTYLINGYSSFSYMQRYFEVDNMKNLTEAEKEERKKELSYTIMAYEKIYPVNFAIALICDCEEEVSDAEKYKSAKQIKSTIRNEYVKNREDTFFVVHDNEQEDVEIIHDKFENLSALEMQYAMVGKEVNLAFFNCIHLEDEESFMEQNDYNLLCAYQCIEEEQEIDINDLILALQENEALDKDAFNGVDYNNQAIE